jgi:hypothetical protein
MNFASARLLRNLPKKVGNTLAPLRRISSTIVLKFIFLNGDVTQRVSLQIIGSL